jgi:amino acid transporter
MISLQQVVHIFVYLLVVAIVFGLLYWLANFVGRKFPTMAPFIPVAHIVLAILGVLLIVGILLSLVGGTPIIRL